MATLTNPVNPQNIVDRFADYVVSTANAGIIWGTDNVPFSEMDVAYFGGTTSGKSIGISGTNIAAVGDTITASNIYNALVAESSAYTHIRNLQAILYVDGEGGNTGSRPTAGVVYDNTQVAYLNTGYLQSVGSPDAAGVSSGGTVTSSGLESLFTNLQTAYNSARSTTQTIQINVCHAACHSSCHGSRGRR